MSPWRDRVGALFLASTGLLACPEPATAAELLPRDLRGSITGRAFEADRGQTIPVLIDPGAFALFGAAETERIIAAAVAAWQVPPVALAIVGSGDLNASDPPFTDPYAPTVITMGFKADTSAPDPYCASGGFASARVGGGLPLAAFTQVFGGRGYDPQGPCRVTLTYDPRDTFERCPHFEPCFFVNVLAHELGHCLGFNHIAHPAIMSDDAMPVCTCGHPTALDMDAFRTVYPTAPPVHIVTSRKLPPAQVGMPYAVQLAAAGGRASYTWSVGTNAFGAPLPFPPQLMLGTDGLLQGLFEEAAAGGGSAMVVDADGDWYKLLFEVEAVDVPPTTVATSTTTTLAMAIEPGIYSCATSTTAPPVDRCEEAAASACAAAVCHLEMLEPRIDDLPRPIGAWLRRLDRDVHAARTFFDSIPARTRRGRRATAHAGRLASRLDRALGKPRIANRIPVELRGVLADRVSRSLGALRSCAGAPSA